MIPNKMLTFLFMTGFLVALTACGGGGGGGGVGGAIGQADQIAPTVASTSPAAGEANVGTASAVIVTFSEPMNAATVNENTVRVLADGQALSGSVTYVDSPAPQATFVADGGLPDGQALTIRVLADATDLASNRLDGQRNFEFSTIDLTAPVLQVSFPGNTPFTTASSLAFAGAARDFSRIDRVETNGFSVQTDDDFASWRTRLNLFEGDNSVRIVGQDAAGNASEINLTVRNDILLTSVTDVGFDSRNDRLVVASSPVTTIEEVALFTVDFQTGVTKLLSQFGVRGSGPEIAIIGGIFVSGNNNDAWVTDFSNDAIYEIDLVSGNRVEISGQNVGNGPRMNGINQITYDPLGDRLFATDTFNGVVFAVERDTGDRSVFTTLLTNPRGIAYDLATRFLYIADQATGQVHVFDSNDSSNNGVTSDDNDPGPDLIEPIAMTYDSLRDRLYLSDVGLGAVVQVELSGARTVLGEIGDGEGPLEAIGGLDYDRGRDSLFMGDPQLNAALFVGSTGRSELTKTAIGSGPRLRDARSLNATADGQLLTVKKVGIDTDVLVIDANDGDRVTSEEAFGPGSGPELVDLRTVAVAPSGDEAFIISTFGLAKIMGLNLTTGERRIVSGDGVGGGQDLSFPDRLATNADGSKIWVSDFRRVMEIDTATGDRFQLTGDDRGTGPVFDTIPGALVLDEARNRLLVAFRVDILAVDLATGDRTVLSDGNAGGPTLEFFPGLALDSANGRLIAAGTAFSSQDSLISVDLETGAREEISGANRGEGTLPFLISGLVVEAENGRAFVSDQRLNAIFVIDLESGDRAVFSK
ncbi:MAG: Ig-like domain-containing protein [Planctomycetota bacterium]